MKDLEDLLKKSRGPKPRRSLGASFTSHVLAHLDPKPPKRPWWARYLESRARHLPKPIAAMLAVIVAVVIGGSTYAVVTNWPNTSATLKEDKPLASGNHIVAIDTENCLVSVALNGMAKPDGRRTLYYELKQDSQLTTARFVDMIKATCEENVANNVISSIIRKRHGDRSQFGKNMTALNSATMRIKAIDKTNITVVDAFKSPGHTDPPKVLTYTHFAKDLEVSHRGGRIAYTDLKVGDTVKLLALYEFGKTQNDPRNPTYWQDADRITIEAIVRMPALVESIELFQSKIATDFVRVEPCKTSLNGFCRQYDFK